MSLKKPKFWDYKQPNLFSYILLPLAYVLQILNTLKKLITSTKNTQKLNLFVLAIFIWVAQEKHP